VGQSLAHDVAIYSFQDHTRRILWLDTVDYCSSVIHSQYRSLDFENHNGCLNPALALLDHRLRQGAFDGARAHR